MAIDEISQDRVAGHQGATWNNRGCEEVSIDALRTNLNSKELEKIHLDMDGSCVYVHSKVRPPLTDAE